MANDGMVTEIQYVNIPEIKVRVVLTKERVGQGMDDYFINIQGDWFIKWAKECVLLDKIGKKGRIKLFSNDLDKDGDKSKSLYFGFMGRLHRINFNSNDYVTFLHIAAEIVGLKTMADAQAER